MDEFQAIGFTFHLIFFFTVMRAGHRLDKAAQPWQMMMVARFHMVDSLFVPTT